MIAGFNTLVGEVHTLPLQHMDIKMIHWMHKIQVCNSKGVLNQRNYKCTLAVMTPKPIRYKQACREHNKFSTRLFKLFSQRSGGLIVAWSLTYSSKHQYTTITLFEQHTRDEQQQRRPTPTVVHFDPNQFVDYLCSDDGSYTLREIIKVLKQ